MLSFCYHVRLRVAGEENSTIFLTSQWNVLIPNLVARDLSSKELSTTNPGNFDF
ncbi:MAG: hypothetical protein RXS23_06125 [Metallosphaera yellowstonensis]